MFFLLSFIFVSTICSTYEQTIKKIKTEYVANSEVRSLKELALIKNIEYFYKGILPEKLKNNLPSDLSNIITTETDRIRYFADLHDLFVPFRGCLSGNYESVINIFNSINKYRERISSRESNTYKISYYYTELKNILNLKYETISARPVPSWDEPILQNENNEINNNILSLIKKRNIPVPAFALSLLALDHKAIQQLKNDEDDLARAEYIFQDSFRNVLAKFVKSQGSNYMKVNFLPKNQKKDVHSKIENLLWEPANEICKDLTKQALYKGKNGCDPIYDEDLNNSDNDDFYDAYISESESDS